MNPIRWKLHWQILLSLTLAALFGALIIPALGEGGGAGLIEFCRFIGKLFMNALKMVIVPLIVASIISGVMHLGAEKGVGRMGFKTFLYYTFSGAAAVVIGLVVGCNAHQFAARRNLGRYQRALNKVRVTVRDILKR